MRKFFFFQSLDFLFRNCKTESMNSPDAIISASNFISDVFARLRCSTSCSRRRRLAPFKEDIGNSKKIHLVFKKSSSSEICVILA